MGDASPTGGHTSPGGVPSKAPDSPTSIKPFSDAFSPGGAVTGLETETTTKSEPARQKEFERKQLELDNEQRRIREDREHAFALFRQRVVFGLSCFVLVVALSFTGWIIADKNSSSERREKAYAFWGLVLGGAGTVFFGIARPKP